MASATSATSATSAASQHLYSCDQCSTPKTILFVCNRCKQVRYCTKDCQTKAWKLHKLVCYMLNWVSPLPQPRGPIQLWYQESNQRISQLTQEEFHRLTRAYFSRHPVATPETIKTLQLKNEAIPAPLLPPSAILIKRTEKKGLGLFAQERIPSGTYICPVGGEFHTDPRKTYADSQNQMNRHCSQTKVRGPASFANDGWPNASCLYMGHEGNDYLIAITDIPPGAEILCNHSHEHMIKYGMYHIEHEHYEEIKEFIESSPFQDFLSGKSANGYPNKQSALEMSRFLYLAQTPPVLIRLFFDHLLTTDNIKQILLAACGYGMPKWVDTYPNLFKKLDWIQTQLPNKIFLFQGLLRTLSFTTFGYLLSLIDLSTAERDLHQYKTTGELLEKICYVLHGTYEGTRLGYDEPFPRIELDVNRFVETALTLHPSCANAVRRMIQEVSLCNETREESQHIFREIVQRWSR